MFAPDTFGELKRRQRLEQREERPAKQSRLLTRDDGHRPGIGKEAAAAMRFRRCIAASLLRLQHLDERVPLPRVTRCTRDGVPPGARIAGVAGEEVGQARVVERVIGRPAA